MDLKKLFTEDRGVSPVIGVILMVAITVILAAVIGAFVLGLGDQASQTTPQASFSFDYDDTGNGSVSATHDGGETIPGSQLNISVSADGWENSTVWDEDRDISAGSTSPTINGSEGDNLAFERDDTVRVIWTGDGSSNTLATYDIPRNAQGE